MFSKKESEKPYVRLPNDDRRQAVRVTPYDEVMIGIAGQQAAIHDISAGGLSFVMAGLQEGRNYDCVLVLNGHTAPLDLGLQVIRIDAEGICSCRFLKLPRAQEELLHRYVLEVQKRKIRAQRAASELATGT